LGDLWSDYRKTSQQDRDPDAAHASRGQGSVPLLDDMKGILQWD
jgi:hypothetical protein